MYNKAKLDIIQYNLKINTQKKKRFLNGNNVFNYENDYLYNGIDILFDIE